MMNLSFSLLTTKQREVQGFLVSFHFLPSCDIYLVFRLFSHIHIHIHDAINTLPTADIERTLTLLSFKLGNKANSPSTNLERALLIAVQSLNLTNQTGFCGQ